jgi:hypothetical protein
VTNCTFSGNDDRAIWNDGTLTVTRTRFSGNSGSAILNGYLAGTLTVTGSAFSGNSGSIYGGGGIISEGGSVTVSDSTFSENRAGRGGGLAVRGGTVTVTNSTFSENIADVGGAVVNEHHYGALTVSNSTFSGNAGFFGGGGIANEGTLTVVNSTFSENAAPGGRGGGIGNVGLDWGGPVLATVINSTFSGNSAGRDGGIANSATLTVTNTIVANSGGGNCGSVTDGGHNLQWPGIECGDSIRSSDPRPDPDGLKGNGGRTQTIAMLPDSPAIDAGDPEVCANPPVNGFDQRGYVRPGTGYANCSIGAYEYNSPGPPTGCVGDCDANAQVTVNEIITLVNIALGTGSTAECASGDADLNDEISIDEILKAVNNALNGCPAPPTPTPAPTQTPTPSATGTPPTLTPTVTPTATVTGTPPTPTITAPPTPTRAPTRTLASPPTGTPTKTPAPSPTPSVTGMPTGAA